MTRLVRLALSEEEARAAIAAVREVLRSRPPWVDPVHLRAAEIALRDGLAEYTATGPDAEGIASGPVHAFTLDGVRTAVCQVVLDRRPATGWAFRGTDRTTVPACELHAWTEAELREATGT